MVFDNLSTGHAAAVPPGAALIQGDLADPAALESALAPGGWDGVLHFAALSLVGDSMRAPMRYLADNAGNGIRLIDAAIRHGAPRFVLSSTAALFGAPETIPIDEDARIEPGSPYGESKHMLERALFWAARIHGLRSAVLRYFNAAGADPAGRLGEDHRPETHLIPLVIDAALGRRADIAVFGTDYPTPDGTCIRDYVHVTDLADAHLRALARLDAPLEEGPLGGDPLEGGRATYNLGTAAGHSVREVIAAVERVSGRRVPVRLAPRRPGDPPVLVAAAGRIARETGWAPRLTLDDMVRTALDWRLAHPDGYGPS